jgi:signal transduction histidine kinase/DNA-binding response OmpR family regulator
MACPASAYANSDILFNVKGLPGVSATVTMLEDETGQAGVPESSRRADFKPLSNNLFQPIGLHPVWLRIDIEVPATLIGKTAWLELMPPYLYDLRFYQADFAEQRSGIGQNFSAHSMDTLMPTFAVNLQQPLTQVYLRVQGAALRNAQLQLLSAEALHKSQMHAGQLNAFFLGLLLLMLLVNSVNWAWTREKIFRSYGGFLVSALAFFLVSNNYAAAYVLQDDASWVLLLLKLSASCAVASMVFFSVKVMQLEQHLPRLARGLQGLGWVLILSNLIVFHLPWLPRLFQFNAFCYLLLSLLMLAISARQAWKIRTRQAILVWAIFLLFTLFDKIQLLSSLGLVPMIEWGLDIRKLAYLVLLLPMHALLVAQFRQQQIEKHASDRVAASARQDAMSAQRQGAELARFMALLSQCDKAIVQAADAHQLMSTLCQKISQEGQFEWAWIGLTKPDDETKIDPMAQYGSIGFDFQSIQAVWGINQLAGVNATTKALQTGFTQTERFTASIPLVHQEQVLGVLVVHTASLHGFRPAEVSLLGEIARNMAFGLQTLRVQSELARHQMQLEGLVHARTQEIEVLNVDLTRKKEEAEVANRAKDDFISNLSHELRTPLNAVLGLTRLLEESPLNQRQHDYLEKIQLSGKVLRTLIDDILDFSKIKANELKLDPVPFSLDVLLTTLTSVLGVGIGHKPIEPLLDVAPDVPDAWVGDGLRLQQILLNFISNAVKFTPHGDIALSVQRLADSELMDPTQVRLQFSVRDTGIGMSDETRQLIFNGFTQADASISRLYGGTGLGLTISARLAALMGGQIEVSSRLGQGSEFRLTVPLALGPKAVRPRPTWTNADVRVLLVGSHALARSQVTQMAQRLGWQVNAFDGGAAGLRALQRSVIEGQPYDLLLLDWHMPGMSGAEMLRQAQAQDVYGGRCPALVLMAPMVDLEQVVAASAPFSPQATLAKPLMPRSLLDALTSRTVGRFATSREAGPKLPKNVPRLQQLRLLVAEDNALNQEVIEYLLTQAGAEVVLAADGQAAVAALQVPGARFDAVLMDIQMPVMDGYAATRQIREVLGLQDLPIIAMTAHARPQDHEKSRLAGMVGHLVKPLHVEDLLNILVRNAGQRPAAQQAIEATA